jgi:hypothetical protein
MAPDWPDQADTLAALAAAARQTGGSLTRVGPAGLELTLPATLPLAVNATALPAFPLQIRGPRGVLAVAATEDPAALVAALAAWRRLAPAPDLAAALAPPPPGWIVSELDRATATLLRGAAGDGGWPVAAQLNTAPGALCFAVELPLAPAGPAHERALARFVALANPDLAPLELRHAPAGEHHGRARVHIRFTLAALGCGPAHLAAGLAEVAGLYARAAPALAALAEQPALAAAFLNAAAPDQLKEITRQ